MSSIAHQVHLCLHVLKLSKEEIDRLKEELGVASLKKALRPFGDPTKPLPYLLGDGSYVTYFRECRPFFQHAKELSGEELIRDLLTYEVLMATFETYYLGRAYGSNAKLQAGIKKVYQGASELGWVHGPCPIENEINDTNPDHVRKHRDGYLPQDARQIVEYLHQHSKAYAIPADIAYQCGLREDEVAGLKKSSLDPVNQALNIRGKGGKRRSVPIPPVLMQQVMSLRPVNYFFTPSESWCANFRTTVQKACLAQGLDGSGVHRLRSTYAQLQYTRFRSEGMTDEEARLKVSHLLGHERISVTSIYVPIGFCWEEYLPYLSDYLNETWK